MAKLFFLLFLLLISFSISESISWPLNLETHYPYTHRVPPPPLAVAPAENYSPEITPPPPPPHPSSSTPSKTSTKKIVAAVAATAATTFAAVGLLFLFWSKFSRQPSGGESNHKPPFPTAPGSRSEFTRLGGRIKGVIIDEDGLDVIYWRSLKSNTRSRTSSFNSGGGVGGGGQTPPAPPPPGGSKKLEAVAKQELHNSIVKDSFQYNGDMMEAMFGFMATNRKVPIEGLNPNAKIFILDPQKSQETAIVVKSIGVPPGKLIESLLKGKGLSVEALEKLVRITPTRTEESEIMAFDGDPTRLADAELFFYRLLKAVPSAFTRANAMLFRARHDSKIVVVKESLQTLESACSEIRSCECGVFLKLLEAILNAGNQLNGGTATNVESFSLSKLLKLSDYRSSDGKTTLLNFVVHKVVRNEGRRCVSTSSTNRNYNANPATQSNDPVVKAEKEREFLKLGLPVVGGLSSDFSNVKKAASLDYEALTSSLASLKTQVDETRGFLESADAEIKAIQEKHTRVMEFVMRATQHYQAADSSDSNPLHLFVMVKDFLVMVDQACVEIARSLQQKPTTAVDILKGRVTFPRLPDSVSRG